MIVRAKRNQGLIASPGINKKKDLISLKGPGVFVSLFVTKQGGSNDLTQVALFIDGVNVVALTYAGARSAGLNRANNSGIILCDGNVIDGFTVQFNEPLAYAKELRVQINTGSDSGVAQIVAVAVTGDSCSYPA